MFSYWQGYEIDGSDSSYNLITPDRDKTIEILLYYLSLKTIRREQQLKVRYKYKEKSYSRQYSEAEVFFKNSAPHKLAEFLRSPDIVSAIVYYSYIEPGRLFPEVKREIIDIMISLLPKGKKKPVLHEPVLWEEFATQDNIEVFLSQEAAAQANKYSWDITGEEYNKKMLAGAFATIEFNCRIGADFGFVAYNIKHMAERFPELGIDYKTEIAFIKDDFYLSGTSIYERINIVSNDYVSTLLRFTEYEEFWFSHFRSRLGNRDSKELMQVYHIPEYISGWDSLKIAREYDSQGNLINDWDYDYLDILKGLSGGKEVFTPAEYIEYVEKLAQSKYFSATDFTAYSSVNVNLKIKGNSFRCFVRFIKRGGKIQMVFDVPVEIYEYVKKRFFIG